MLTLDQTHDAAAKSWLTAANEPDGDFPIQNLPFCVFREAGTGNAFRGGVGLGDQIIDLAALAETGLLSPYAQSAAKACDKPALNGLLELGPHAWRTLRHALFDLFHDRYTREGTATCLDKLASCLVQQSAAQFKVPAEIGGYSDFYTSIHHARTIMTLLAAGSPLPANFSWVPLVYNGRTSSIGISGGEIVRPFGQALPVGATEPVFRPTQRLDYELELAIFIGRGNSLGSRIDIAEAADHIFGLALLNDWSARDIQTWEMMPLGPFHAKNFATTLSPWIVTMDALAPFRLPWDRPAGDPQPLQHLDHSSVRAHGAIDIQLETRMGTRLGRETGTASERVAFTNFKHQYWTIEQMVTHHASSGCNLQAGDLLGTGTISGPGANEAGALIELSLAGNRPVVLATGEKRSFLEDGDEVTFGAWCKREGVARIGFGTLTGVVAPAR